MKKYRKNEALLMKFDVQSHKYDFRLDIPKLNYRHYYKNDLENKISSLIKNFYEKQKRIFSL